MSSSCKLMYTCYSLDYIIDISYHTPNKVNLVKLPTWAYHVYHIDPSLLGASIFPSSLRSNWKNRLFFSPFLMRLAHWPWFLHHQKSWKNPNGFPCFTVKSPCSPCFSCFKSIPPGCPCAIHGVKDDSKLGARGVKAVRVDDDLNDADLDFLWFTLW